MSASGWYRAAAVITALFCAGHSSGALPGKPIPGAEGVVAAMRSVRFVMFGAERTYWDFFYGYGVLVAVTAGFVAVLLWTLARTDRGASRPIALLTAVAQLGFAAVSFRWFFWAPGAFNLAAAACAVVGATADRARAAPSG
jgi:hypothetical protein